MNPPATEPIETYEARETTGRSRSVPEEAPPRSIVVVGASLAGGTATGVLRDEATTAASR